ncbi:hypothetical protein MMC24_002127 [Lignoscripta atroalba]|nr:hypothetical protein [Lignoscripta atroalba]
MPAVRVTLALNTKQSQKVPLLLPSSTSLDPTSSTSCHALVLKAAQSKLRVKKASRVFVAGTGQELAKEQDWKNVLKDDVVLLISAGEEYVGTKKEETLSELGEDGQTINNVSSTAGNPDCTINILANKASIDPLSITQVETTARTLPGIIHAVAQPDLHPGTKFPIGAVFVSEGWIHPPLIGGDIGCGMAWYKTKLSAAQVEGDKGRKVAEKLRGVEGPWRTQENRVMWLSDYSSSGGETSASAGEEWDAALGTIGAGNHFAELQVVEEVIKGEYMTPDPQNPEDPQTMLNEGEVVLLVHSGSRGYGGNILKRYTLDGRISIPSTDPLATSYLQEHDHACAWATRSRDLIALRFLACLEPGEEDWQLGVNDPVSTATAEAISAAAQKIKSRKVVDIWHNNVEITTWPPSPPPSLLSSLSPSAPTPTTTQVFIHRKGAAPTLQPSTSLPLSVLPLPGSRGTPTLILSPLLNPSNGYGLSNALSLAHGAGRAMSRAKAAGYVAQKYKGRAEDLLRGDFVRVDSRGNKSQHPQQRQRDLVGNRQGGPGAGGGEYINRGTWVVCEDKQLVWEEAPEAYKDVWEVGADLVDGGWASRVGWCRGRVSYKVRNE